jgi:glycosyltransferase involved in cell wall biosynthesis
MNGPPRISVVIPAHNRAELLRATLESVFRQTVAEFEVVLVDDGSTDHTPEVARAYSRIDHRLRYVRQANGGVGRARNHGIQLARAEWVACLDSDDLWLPDKIERDLEAARRHPEAQVLYGGVRFFRGSAVSPARFARLKGQDVLEPLSLRNLFSVGAVTVRRDCLLVVSGFREDRALGASADWDLWVRLAARYRFAATEAASLLVREHPSNMMHDPAGMERAMRAAVASFLTDPVAGPRLTPFTARIESRMLLWAAVGYYGCGQTATARARLASAWALDAGVAREPLWIYTLVRSLLGARLSSSLRLLKRAIRNWTSRPREAASS